MFTTNSTGYPGCKYIDKDAEGRKDFSEIIEIAKQCQPPVEIEHGEIIGGFAHNQVLQLAEQCRCCEDRGHTPLYRNGRL